MGARAGKYKFGARVGKHKLGARAGKYKLGARAGGQGRGPSKAPGVGNQAKGRGYAFLYTSEKKLYYNRAFSFLISFFF